MLIPPSPEYIVPGMKLGSESGYSHYYNWLHLVFPLYSLSSAGFKILVSKRRILPIWKITMVSLNQKVKLLFGHF